MIITTQAMVENNKYKRLNYKLSVAQIVYILGKTDKFLQQMNGL